ncbi:hypothetical protein [Diaphorobacter caeni]|uniref:hypothetical protein n=1 Tax=Diaphorobacter caeni TaxID=2784387 RepID=UPI00188ED1CB|nr:hypothetical protein [Diaphorobacter caeni]MBF5006321.1 hypothetical protein [Diaphorobacter caeni]
MKIGTTGQTPSLSTIQNSLNVGGVSDKTELRATPTTLYSKGMFTDITLGKEARVQRQAQARDLLNRAVEQEFAGLIPQYAAAVKKKMTDILDGHAPITKGVVDEVAAEVDRIKGLRASFKNSENNALIVDSQDFQAGKQQASTLLKTPPKDFMDAMESYVETLKDVNQLLFEKRPLVGGMKFVGSAKSAVTTSSAPVTLTAEMEKKLQDDLQRLGALQVFMDDVRYGAADHAALSRAADAMEVAAQSGADSVTMLPQSVVLNQTGSALDQQGRCLPLVALAAVAESIPGPGMDSLVGRLRSETQKHYENGVREQTPYVAKLAAMHGSGIVSNHSSPVSTVTKGHRDVVDHLAQGALASTPAAPSFYGLETRSHIMMIGVTQHGKDQCFMFYDPNFGVTRFDSSDKLKDFLDRYFGDELGYGNDYDMSRQSPQSGFEFNKVIELDFQGIAKDPQFSVTSMIQ